MPRRIGTSILLAASLALGLTALAGFAQAGDAKLAETVLAQVIRAREIVKANCAFDILRENPLGEIACKAGAKTSGEAWDEALTEAGLPAAGRATLTESLGLTPAPEDDKSALWRADPKDVARLIANLRLLAGG